MGEKYVTRTETDIWGNDQIVTRRSVTAYDVGSAVGIGVGLLAVAHQNSQMKAAEDNVKAAQKHLENSDYDRAITSANSLIARNDKEAQAIGHFFKASALASLERYDEAINEFTTTIDMGRTFTQIEALAITFIGRGACYYEKNDIGAALRDFTRYMQMQPNEDISYYWQGLALVKLGDLDQALAKFSQAVTINPGDAANYRERANVYVRRKETQKAIEDFYRAITLNPRDATCYRRRAELYASINEYQRAIADYSLAIEIAPDELENYRGRSAVYQRIGDTARSAADMGKVAQEEPLQEMYRAYFQAASTAYDQGITATYIDADKQIKPNWGSSILPIMGAGVIGLFGIGFCAIAAVSLGGAGAGSSLLLILSSFALIWWIINSRRSQAAHKVKAATAYLQMRTENEARMPGFEEFFWHFLQAKKEARLQELPARTRAFFASGPGSRAVQAYAARSQA
jgi:tetratricopeptide (TPR) repeat protein